MAPTGFTKERAEELKRLAEQGFNERNPRIIDTKEIMGVPATGKPVALSGLSAAVMENGRILQHWEFSDDRSLMAQLEAGGT
jgi:predicted ester cyclase